MVPYSNSLLRWEGNEAVALDYSERNIFTKWSKLWILTDDQKNPIQENEIIKWSWSVNLEYTSVNLIANVDSDSNYTEFNNIVVASNVWWVKSSCKNYLDTNSSLAWKDWFYMIFSKD